MNPKNVPHSVALNTYHGNQYKPILDLTLDSNLKLNAPSQEIVQIDSLHTLAAISFATFDSNAYVKPRMEQTPFSRLRPLLQQSIPSYNGPLTSTKDDSM